MKKYVNYEYSSGNRVFIVKIEKKKYKKISKEEWYFPHFFARIMKECSTILVEKKI
jgi:hypothetical protein